MPKQSVARSYFLYLKFMLDSLFDLAGVMAYTHTPLI
jgi:hypothetical protein